MKTGKGKDYDTTKEGKLVLKNLGRASFGPCHMATLIENQKVIVDNQFKIYAALAVLVKHELSDLVVGEWEGK